MQRFFFDVESQVHELTIAIENYFLVWKFMSYGTIFWSLQFTSVDLIFALGANIF